MARGDRIFIGGAAIAVLLALILGWSLQPEQPNFAGDRGYQEQSASYRAGGAECEPAGINSLPTRLRQRKTDACANAEEQHREAANSLIEARRSAVASEAQAAYTAIQARIEAWGAAIGLLTLFAAVAAAFFAKRAAEHTETNAIEARRAANVAAEGLEESKRQAYISMRAYIHAGTTGFQETHGTSSPKRIEIPWENYGQTPALRYGVMTCVRIAHPNQSFAEVLSDVPPVDRANGRSIAQRRHAIARTDPITHETLMGAFRKQFKILILARIEYSDAIREEDHVSQECWELSVEGIGPQNQIGDFNVAYILLHASEFYIAT